MQKKSACWMKKAVQIPAAAICLAGLAVLRPCHAELRPLWEIGVGIGALGLPDYRGSDVTSTYVLPVPYFVYRGKFLKADRAGLRGTLFDNDKVEVNVSLNATLPVNSKNNPTRVGMADLKPAVELGPTVSVNLWYSHDRKMKLDLRAPLRAAITIESSPKNIGWLFSPNLNLAVKDLGAWTDWNLGISAGPFFNNRKYNAYFYSVSPVDATATRPAYGAAGGYAGSQASLILSKRFPSYWVGGFLRYDTIAGAVFNNSPLVKQRSGVLVGIAVAWIFNASSQLVDTEE